MEEKAGTRLEHVEPLKILGAGIARSGKGLSESVVKTFRYAEAVGDADGEGSR